MPGVVVALGRAEEAGQPLQAQGSLRLRPTFGVEGDRYALDRGHFRNIPDAEVTLSEAEEAEALGFPLLALRRNIVTRGVPLAPLIGRRVRIGGAVLHVIRVCAPCTTLEAHLGRPLIGAIHGGLRARIEQGGEVRVGDAIEVLETGPVLDADMRAVVASAHLCFAATVTPDGRPNVSPKGTIRVLDDHRLFFLDLRSPQTRRNLRANPWMELNVVDALSRRGYRFLGRATIHQDDDVHRAAVARIAEEEGVLYDAHATIVLEVERALPLRSPGYAHVPTEEAMRAAWRERRQALDAAFEGHLAAARSPP